MRVTNNTPYPIATDAGTIAPGADGDVDGNSATVKAWIEAGALAKVEKAPAKPDPKDK